MLDKIHRFTSGFGQQLTGVSVDSLPVAWPREQLEWSMDTYSCCCPGQIRFARYLATFRCRFFNGILGLGGR
jgi:hypothetical protein